MEKKSELKEVKKQLTDYQALKEDGKGESIQGNILWKEGKEKQKKVRQEVKKIKISGRYTGAGKSGKGEKDGSSLGKVEHKKI